MMNKTDILSSPHKHDGSTVRSVMNKVCLALLPGLACYVWYFGLAVLVQCLLAVCFALAIEALLLRVRRREVSLFLWDGSAIVTGLLFALMITPFAPWWISLAGISFGMIFAKHIYGGLGHNLFNPAATAYIFVLLSFPVVMNYWPVPAGMFGEGSNPVNILRIIFVNPAPAEIIATRITEQGSVQISLDSLSGATPLANMQNRLASRDMISEIRSNPMYGSLAGKGWEWINLGFLLGGAGLIISGVIAWRIPVAVIGSVFVTSMIFNVYNPDVYAGPLFHLFSGGTMLGAFFIATDPVTASSTPRGRIIYGCLIGVTACIIRIWAAYPDGIAFAVLIANAFVPLIDRYTRPRVLGEYGKNACLKIPEQTDV